MAKHHALLLSALVVLMVAQLSIAAKKKYTVYVPKGKLTCFSEVLQHKGIFKISYQILGMNGRPLKLENPDDSIISVYFSRSQDGSKVYRNSSYSGTHSHTVYGSNFYISFCAENFSEDTDVKFSVEIAWALDINDFSDIPLSVSLHLRRTKTETWRSPSRNSSHTRTTSCRWTPLSTARSPSWTDPTKLPTSSWA